MEMHLFLALFENETDIPRYIDTNFKTIGQVVLNKSHRPRTAYLGVFKLNQKIWCNLYGTMNYNNWYDRIIFLWNSDYYVICHSHRFYYRQPRNRIRSLMSKTRIEIFDSEHIIFLNSLPNTNFPLILWKQWRKSNSNGSIFRSLTF